MTERGQREKTPDCPINNRMYGQYFFCSPYIILGVSVSFPKTFFFTYFKSLLGYVVLSRAQIFNLQLHIIIRLPVLM